MQLFTMEKKLEKKGEEPQSKYLQCLRHDSQNDWSVLEAKRNAILGRLDA